MPNPFNPLDWLKTAQDWFAKTERSSGFRPFLIYLLLCFGAGIVLLSIAGERPMVEALGLVLIAIPALSFIPLYGWKSHADPDFCRSETHVQRLKKIELEAMGTESFQIDGEIIEQKAIAASIREPSALGDSSSAEGGA
ncbi:hypothetical protein [Nevskia sp.]|uniref:hypothetical protein n=1 Tax=Nevskia sp. TaxID=1929292 RepID=UPI003F72F24F